MNCIIVDDEPLAREAMKLLIEESDNLQLIGSFNRVCPYDFQKNTGYFHHSLYRICAG